MLKRHLASHYSLMSHVCSPSPVCERVGGSVDPSFEESSSERRAPLPTYTAHEPVAVRAR